MKNIVHKLQILIFGLFCITYGGNVIKLKDNLNSASDIVVLKDSMSYAVCSDFALRPFGIIKSINDLSKSQLNIFKTLKTTSVQGSDTITIYKLKNGESYFNLFIDTFSESSPGYEYIWNGYLVNKTVIFKNGIHVGMNFSDFRDILFDEFTIENNQEIKTISIEYCVASLRQIYRFQNSKLHSIQFESPYLYWKL